MHPLHYILHFFRDLLIIFSVASGVRILDKGFELLNSIIPLSHDHPSIPSYLNIDIVAAIVTVLDMVAIMTIGIIGISTVIKAWREHLAWRHNRVPCDRPDCPQKNSHTTKEG